jgi:hypothetical protein
VLRAGLESGQGDAHRDRRLCHQFSLVNEAASMIQHQFERVGSDTLFAGIDKDELARRPFDTELAAEGLIAPTMAVVSGNLNFLMKNKVADSNSIYLLQISEQNES